jgi:phospholipid-binding lipoprotein MlaA
MKLNSPAWGRLAAAGACALALAGCATNNPKDPFEPYNRAMFAFNDKVDQVALKPAATVYKNATPSFFQTGVNNFFGNLADIWTGANNLLQGKGADGMSDLSRVALNSTFGLFGLLDIASEAGLPKHKEDFGQTLGRYGVPAGPYLVLPVLGPSTVRDTAGLPMDIAADPWAHLNNMALRNSGTALRIIDQRAQLLDATNLLEDAALDRYVFVRDSWMQSRRSKVYDGDPPAEKSGQGEDEDAPSSAASIKSAYEDDPGPTQDSGTAAPAQPGAGTAAMGTSGSGAATAGTASPAAPSGSPSGTAPAPAGNVPSQTGDKPASSDKPVK